VFLNDISIPDKAVAEVVIRALMTIFPECDKACKDVSRLFFGGKKLIYFDDSISEINIEGLMMGLYLYLRTTAGETHYREGLKRLAKNTGLTYDRDSLLGVETFQGDIESGKFSPSTIIYIKDNGEKLPVFYAITFEKDKCTNPIPAKKRHKPHRSEVIDKIREQCRLFSEFESGERWLLHEELFGIATNLIHVEGGIPLFLEIIREQSKGYSSYGDKDWQYYLYYFQAKDYKPITCDCDGFCPYATKCSHGANILNTAKVGKNEIIKLSTGEELVSIEKSEQDLKCRFQQALEEDDDRIHVIKAQTALGKTELYLNYIGNATRPCMIAVPTNRLKHEVVERARDMGIRVMNTPSLPEILDDLPMRISEPIHYFYATGQYNRIMPYVLAVQRDEQDPVLQRYLEEKAAVRIFDGHLITTHANLLRQPKETLDKYDVIIDEDIIASILQGQVVIRIHDLKKALRSKALGESIKEKINQAIELGKICGYFTLPSTEYPDCTDSTINLPAFAEATHFYADNRQYLHFYRDLTLSPGKYTVLSATADEAVYRYFFGSGRVRFDNVKQAAYTGRLIQYHDQTYSRACVNAAEDLYNIIREKHGDVPIITFKGYIEDDIMHYGNTEGCDCWAGQDIAVVGTPHKPEFIYKLLAYQLGLNIESELAPREVMRNGYKFNFMTYDDEQLQKIQLWLIESDLEQAVGRARLLRKDCTVWLYSNFPLKQAELIGAGRQDG